uniref:Uncharacterized protein n=1 Tax=Anguilla anguilla TaxID=7936 RepID=A0A0E9WUY1_ANGAN
MSRFLIYVTANKPKRGMKHIDYLAHEEQTAALQTLSSNTALVVTCTTV